MWKHSKRRHAPSGAPKLKAGCRRGRRRKSRAGAAAVEFAVCLPLLITIVLGSIEASNLIHVQHALKTAAYEAARTAGRDSEITPEEIEILAKSVLIAYGVEEGHMDVTPTDIKAVGTGSQITVTVSAPMAVNRVISGWAPEWLLGDSDLSAQCTVVRG